MKGILLACVSALVLAVPAQAMTFYTYHLEGTFRFENDVIGHYYTAHRVLLVTVGENGDCNGASCYVDPSTVSFGLSSEQRDVQFYMTFSAPSGPPPQDANLFQSASFNVESNFWPYGDGWDVSSIALGGLSITTFEADTPWGSGVPVWQLIPGIGEAPEPATWAMMIAGFALAGAALRRRSYSVAFA